MARSRLKDASPMNAAKALPWAALLQGSVAIGKRWRALSSKERSRLLKLVRESGGRPDRLSLKDRKELKKLISKLDLRGAGRELGAMARAFRKSGRRWR